MPTVFAERIDELVKLSGLVQSAASVAAGLSKETLRKWSNAEIVSGNIRELIRFADHHKVSLDWLVGRSDRGGPKKEAAPEVDTLAMAKRAAESLSFELSIPLPVAWEAAYHATRYVDDPASIRRAIKVALAIVGSRKETATLAGGSELPSISRAVGGFERDSEQLNKGTDGVRDGGTGEERH